tara:strand:- start:1904 stop:2617 length:714 start_codon:yes stop_codon:yes gene_type:complete
MIYADDRESEKLLHLLISQLGDSQHDEKGCVRVKRLTCGDYVLGKWGIEAKEINDFYRSIAGIGRNGKTITNQLAELCMTFEVPILAVYGTQMKPYFKRRVSSKIVAAEVAKQKRIMKSYKMTLYARFPKIRLIEFATMADFVEWLTISHTRMVVAKSITAPTFVMDDIPKSDDERVLALCGIPGIGEEIATKLLEHFGSIQEMLKHNRVQKDFMVVKGVGRVLAKRLLNLRRRWDN